MIGRRFVVGLLSVAAGACAAVLGIRQISEPFPHRAHAVAGVACKTCHEDVALAANRDPVRLPADEGCASCHEKDGCNNGPTCRGCHGSQESERLAIQARHYLSFAHVSHVAELDGACMRCHEGVARDSVRLLPKMAQCLGCHEHKNEFELRACGRCHENLETEDTLPASHVVHGPDFATTHGPRASAYADLCATCHTDADCGSCHGVRVPALAARLEIAAPRIEGLHRAGFVSRHGLEARADGGLCVTCHSSETCQQCHEDRGVSNRASPHPADWVGETRNTHGPAARRDPVACASCHGGAGEVLCVSCHKVGAFGGSPHPPGFVSDRRRNERPCVLCH